MTDTVEEQLKKIIGDALDKNIEHISLDDPLRETSDLDSEIDMIEIILGTETHFSIGLTPEEIETTRTGRDLLRAIEKQTR